MRPFVLALIVTCFAAGKVGAQTYPSYPPPFSPSAYPIITDARELQLRVLEGHSQRLAEVERQIRMIKGAAGSRSSNSTGLAPQSVTPRPRRPLP